MRRIRGFALLSILFSATVMAAQNSQTFYLATAARAGNTQLPRGTGAAESWDQDSACDFGTGSSRKFERKGST
jgi:hypothetical protein